MQNNKLINRFLFSLVFLVLFSSQCSSEDSNVGGNNQPDLSPVMFDYVCTNGDPVVGKTDVENTERCDTCEIGFTKQEDETCKTFDYICTNGTPAIGTTGAPDTERCATCDMGYARQEDGTCRASDSFDYICTNGTPVTGTTGAPDTERCATCDMGFTKQQDETCRASGDSGPGTPAPELPVIPGISKISAGVRSALGGGEHTCAVVNGAAKCWGEGASSQLGNNKTSDADTPQDVIALTSGVTDISAAGFYACAVVNGAAKCWGAGANGELGNGRSGPAELATTPQDVSTLTAGVEQISAGGAHACALVGGRAVCWGANTKGQLGNGTQDENATPVQVMGLTTGVEQISAGSAHTCAVVEGRAVCWGANAKGQLGNGAQDENAISATPVQVMGLTTGVEQISAGSAHTCAVVRGRAMCWGNGGGHRLGNGGSGNVDTPQQVVGLTVGVTQISAGSAHTCAVARGRAVCWGNGANGRLGHNETADVNATKPAFTQVYGLTSGVTDITVGNEHTCAVVNDRAVCWGKGLNGRLGNDDTEDSPSPVEVSGL